MLRSLFIQNFALIEHIEIDFEDGFSVITGETGAGKSIILGAIGMLLGQRADVKSIRPGATKCVIEARFYIACYDVRSFFEENGLDYEGECILRRELYASGKSRTFINDTPVSLALIKELGELLVDIHSQYQNLLLHKEGFLLDVLDVLVSNREMLASYRRVYEEWKHVQNELQKLIDASEKAKADEDYLLFQLEQLDEARLIDDEQSELEREAEILEHAEEIKAGLYKAVQLLETDESGALSVLKDCQVTLDSLQSVYVPAGELSERLNAVCIEVNDILHELANKEEDVEFNPARLSEVNERLNLIYALQQKHRVSTIHELLILAEDFRQRLSDIASSDDDIRDLRQRCDACYEEMLHMADELTKKRLDASKIVEQQMVARLAVLGMPNVRFVVELGKRNEPGLYGMDTVTFKFSANKNGALLPISAVASGGEIARVMLSLKAMVAGVIKLPTIIFDEIDTGVSGEIADRMADIMLGMCKGGCQVISITHLPQIAARGRVHYKVYKLDNEKETNSYIRRLTEEERVEEIAHMVSGVVLTEAALENARSLLENARTS